MVMLLLNKLSVSMRWLIWTVSCGCTSATADKHLLVLLGCGGSLDNIVLLQKVAELLL